MPTTTLYSKPNQYQGEVFQYSITAFPLLRMEWMLVQINLWLQFAWT